MTARVFALATCVAVAAVTGTALAAAAGQLDPGFSGDGKLTFSFSNTAMDDDVATDVAAAPGGKIVVVGRSEQGTDDELGVARIKSDGALDATFSGDGRRLIGPYYQDPSINTAAAAVQPDGKIVLGYATSQCQSGSYCFAAVRLNPNGQFDPTFSGDGRRAVSFAGDSAARSVALQPDGGIVIAGSALDGSDQNFAFARLKANGQLDATFATDGKQTVSLDNGPAERANDVVIQPDGTIIAAGLTGSAGLDWFIVALDPGGQLETSFSGDGMRIVSFDPGANAEQANAIVLDPAADNLDLWVVGSSNRGGTNTDFAIARLKANGQLDTSFSQDGKRLQSFDNGTNEDVANDAVAQPDGRVIVVGTSTQTSSGKDAALARFKANGQLDDSIWGDGKRVLTFKPGMAEDGAMGVALTKVGTGKLILSGFSDPEGPFGADFGVAGFILPYLEQSN